MLKRREKTQTENTKHPQTTFKTTTTTATIDLSIDNTHTHFYKKETGGRRRRRSRAAAKSRELSVTTQHPCIVNCIIYAKKKEEKNV
jgi:hypothetical protein